MADIIREKTGTDFGEIVSLHPLKRGASGRIYELEIIGTKHRAVISKELRIRQVLSRTCLYSSWFEVEADREIAREDAYTPCGFILRGHGWGHGVGLCQIGAAEMAMEGFSYKQILAHYYPSSVLSIYQE